MIVIPSSYLAPVSYYALLWAHGCEVCVEQYEYYVKQTLRSRAYIAMAHGKECLTVPVVHSSGVKTPMRDIKISDHGNWRHLHWQALRTAYDKSPFFEFYADEIAHFYEGRPTEWLMEFNLMLTQTVCNLLGMDVSLTLTDEYRAEGDFVDLRCETFDSAQGEPYYQVFAERNGFIGGLSIVDLLFNMGPESLLILDKMKKTSLLVPSP